MIRVLHSVSNMDRAGTETTIMNYYRHIDRSQIQFDFLCNKQKPGAYDEEILHMGGRIFHTPGLNPLKYPLYLKYMKQLFSKHPEYSIIEAHNGSFGVYALHAAKVNNVPVRIFRAQGANTAKDIKRPLKDFCRSRMRYNITNRFACGTDAARFYFGDEVVKKHEFEPVTNAIELERFIFNEKIREDIRLNYNLDGKHVVGHIGRFMVQKNHTFLLDVFAELKKIDPLACLVLLGDGELMQDAMEKAERLGIKDDVLFAGNIPNANEWYQAFDCFVLPSLWEGLPVVGIEAQTADLPCVFSTDVTAETGISDKVQFINLNEGPKAWAIAVHEAVTCELPRRNNEKLMADNHYDIRIEAKRLQERYLELAAQATAKK